MFWGFWWGPHGNFLFSTGLSHSMDPKCLHFLFFKIEIRPDYRGLWIIIAPQYSRNFEPYFFRRGCGLEGLGTLDSSNNLKGTHFRRHPYCTIWPLEFPPPNFDWAELMLGSVSSLGFNKNTFWKWRVPIVMLRMEYFYGTVTKRDLDGLKTFKSQLPNLSRLRIFVWTGKITFVLKPFKIFIRLGEQHQYFAWLNLVTWIRCNISMSFWYTNEITPAKDLCDIVWGFLRTI